MLQIPTLIVEDFLGDYLYCQRSSVYIGEDLSSCVYLRTDYLCIVKDLKRIVYDWIYQIYFVYFVHC